MRTSSILVAGLSLVVSAAALAAQGTSKPAAPPPPPPKAAAQASANPITDSIKSGYDIIKGYLTKSAEQMPEKEYTFKPAGTAAEVRTFGQIIGHIANANHLFCGAAMGASAAGGERGPGGADFEKLTSKAELQKALAGSFAACDKAFTAVNDKNAAQPVTGLPIGPQTKLSTLAFNTAHDFEHYGNLVTYFRAKGMVPPSSQGGR